MSPRHDHPHRQRLSFSLAVLLTTNVHPHLTPFVDGFLGERLTESVKSSLHHVYLDRATML